MGLIDLEFEGKIVVYKSFKDWKFLGAQQAEHPSNPYRKRTLHTQSRAGSCSPEICITANRSVISQSEDAAVSIQARLPQLLLQNLTHLRKENLLICLYVKS